MPIPTACKPDCEICGGFGYIKDPSLNPGDPGFGRFFPCANSNFYYLAEKKYDTGITYDEYNSLTWDGFADNGDVRKALMMVQSTLTRGAGWVTLHGTYGLGKTRILKTAVASFLNQRKYGAIVRMSTILQDLRDSFDDKHQGISDRMQRWIDLPLLCIDEFDRVALTEWGNEQRFVLMDNRYDQACRGESVTMIAMNANPKTLDGYLFDRMGDKRFTVIGINGESFRKVAENQLSIF